MKRRLFVRIFIVISIIVIAACCAKAPKQVKVDDDSGKEILHSPHSTTLPAPEGSPSTGDAPAVSALEDIRPEPSMASTQEPIPSPVTIPKKAVEYETATSGSEREAEKTAPMAKPKPQAYTQPLADYSKAPSPTPTMAKKARLQSRRVGRGKMSPTQPWETTGLDTELWVIAKAPSDSKRKPDKEPPRLNAIVPGEAKEIPLPLKHTDVRAKVSGFIASVDVRQAYHNPYDAKIEAVYVFPLPQSAAVTDFVMIVGDRKIRGLIREKEEAKRIYNQAKSQGYRASLLTQERPNIFQQKVANIEPGKNIDIVLSFFNPLPYRDGEFEFVFPTVVGPRFNPPGTTNGVGAAGRGKPGRSGQSSEVQYLAPDEKSGHDIAISLDIDAGLEIEKVYSRTHAIQVDRKGESRAVVTLSPNDRVPNKDFVVRYKTAGKKVKTGMMVHRAEDGNYFSLLLQPPENMKNLPRMPREMVFVLDCSGSMSGQPLAKAKRAIRRCLQKLQPDDTFQVIRFSSNASALGPNPVPATQKNVKKGLRYVKSLRGGGGTMMIEGIKAALDFPHDEGRLRIVSFMTDGYIGNEWEILAAVKQKLGASRIFSFGIGNSVNRYLLERMAKIGRGAVAFVGLNDSSADKVDEFYDRASRPALANIKIDWSDLNATDVYPKEIPDLFVGRPVVISGRFMGDPASGIRVEGQTGKKRTSHSVKLEGGGTSHPGIRSVWARWKIADLSDRENYAPSQELRNEIRETSLSYGLLSKYTAFLAVDGSERTKGEHGYTVHVPVPVPDGVRYDTTVSE